MSNAPCAGDGCLHEWGGHVVNDDFGKRRIAFVAIRVWWSVIRVKVSTVRQILPDQNRPFSVSWVDSSAFGRHPPRCY